MSLLFAATYPDRTAALVICGSYARYLVAPDYPCGVPSRELFEQVVQHRLATWPDSFDLSIVAPSRAEQPGFRERAVRWLRSSASPKTVAEHMSLYPDIDVRHLLPTVSVPALVLHREGDRFLPVCHGRYLGAHIPGAKYVELPGGDHLPWVNSDDIVEQVQEFLTGTRPTVEVDRVLATVLFTDIVGSTVRAAELGDARWRSLLQQHDEIAKRSIERFRGRWIKSTGDGLLATFDGPARGIRCAREIGQAVSPLGLQIRAGLHTGECELIGDDVGGIAVHIGARVAAVANGDEVMVSSTVKDLVAGSGISFESRGSHSLKGVPGEWQLHAVTAA